MCFSPRQKTLSKYTFVYKLCVLVTFLLLTLLFMDDRGLESLDLQIFFLIVSLGLSISLIKELKINRESTLPAYSDVWIVFGCLLPFSLRLLYV